MKRLVNKFFSLLIPGGLSIKSAITLAIVLFFIFVSLVLIVTSRQLNQLVAYKTAHDFMDEITNQIEIKIKFFFEPSKRFIKNIKYSGNRYGFFEPINEEEVLDYLRNVVVNNEEIGSVYYGNEYGNFYMARRFPDGSVSYGLVLREDTSIERVWRHESIDLNEDFKDFTNGSYPLEGGYDPRKRVWYQEAFAKEGINWSKPYIFSSTRAIGMTLSEAVENENGEKLGVLGIDFSLVDISDFLNSLEVSEFSKIFIINEDDDLLAVSGHESSETVDYLFQVDETGDPVLIKANQIKNNPNVKILYEKYGERVLDKNSESTFSDELKQFILDKLPFLGSFIDSDDGDFVVFFEGEDNDKIAILREVIPDVQFPVKIGIIIPEEIILGEIEQLSSIVGVLILLVSIFILFLALKLSNRLSLELNNMTKKIDKIKNFDLSKPKIKGILSGVTEINEINESYENMRKSLVSFSKFVPGGTVKKLIQKGEEAKLEGFKKNITILFTDIANFTNLTDETAGNTLVGYVGEYFDLMSRIVHHHGGIIDKYIGDAVMALWGAENENQDYDALNACICAMDIVKNLVVFNQDFQKQGKPTFYTRLGLNSGEAIVGNIGSSNRLNYTAIGDSVNVASRIEPLNKTYGTQLLISETTYMEVRDKIICRLIDKTVVKGKQSATTVYEPLGMESELETRDFDFLEHYNNGFRDYVGGNWGRAISHFNLASSIKPEDNHTKSLISRCNQLIGEKPPSWDGIFNQIKSQV